MQQYTVFWKDAFTTITSCSSTCNFAYKKSTVNNESAITLEGNHMLIITETGVPLAIFCAVSRIVIAAGYARPLTADINGVMPLASLGKKNQTS